MDGVLVPTLSQKARKDGAPCYDALSRRTQLTRPNGITTNYAYDSLSRLLSVLHQAGGATIDGAGYTYDNAGNRTSKTNYLNGITENYTYDALYELTQVTQGPSTTESYSYDPMGNRLSSLGVPLYNYNSSNELTSTTLGGYTYDANGNTLTDAQGRSFTWDFENRLTQAVVPGQSGGTTTFRYDPFGRRIQKSGSSGSLNYFYDLNSLVEERDNAGNVSGTYTQAPGMDEPVAQRRSGTVSFYEEDGTDSVSSISTLSGAPVNTYNYDSFGNLNSTTGGMLNPFRFASREYDQDAGIYLNRARYYDQVIGRFISEDPLQFVGASNFYGYSDNNPVTLVDPTGLSAAGAASGLIDLSCYVLGISSCGRHHRNDSVTADLASTPAMNDLRSRYNKNGCRDGKYCGAFSFGQYFTTWNMVGQMVGGFCAHITDRGDGTVDIDAYNVWGAASGSRNPFGDRNKPSLWDMAVNHKPWSTDFSSLWNDWNRGPLGRMRFYYHWREKKPCCGVL